MQNRKRDTDIQNRVLYSLGEGEGGMFWENCIETSILSRVKQITSPGSMHETSVQGWCIGKTQRDGMEREAGGGIGKGNTCKSMADSSQCMAKPKKLKKIKKKNPPAGDIKEGLIPVLRRSLEKEMAIYSSILAWEIPWTEEPGRLQSMGSQRVRSYWAHTHNSIRLFSYILDTHQSTYTLIKQLHEVISL